VRKVDVLQLGNVSGDSRVKKLKWFKKVLF
jgi:hypothetical protein